MQIDTWTNIRAFKYDLEAASWPPNLKPSRGRTSYTVACRTPILRRFYLVWASVSQQHIYQIMERQRLQMKNYAAFEKILLTTKSSRLPGKKSLELHHKCKSCVQLDKSCNTLPLTWAYKNGAKPLFVSFILIALVFAIQPPRRLLLWPSIRSVTCLLMCFFISSLL